MSFYYLLSLASFNFLFRQVVKLKLSFTNSNIIYYIKYVIHPYPIIERRSMTGILLSLMLSTKSIIIIK